MPIFSPEKIVSPVSNENFHEAVTSNIFYGALLNKLEHTCKISEILLKCTKQEEKNSFS